MDPKVQRRLDKLEAFADLMKEHVTVLKKELADSGASKSSARKGKPAVSEKEKARVLAKVQKNRLRKSR